MNEEVRSSKFERRMKKSPRPSQFFIRTSNLELQQFRGGPSPGASRHPLPRERDLHESQSLRDERPDHEHEREKLEAGPQSLPSFESVEDIGQRNVIVSDFPLSQIDRSRFES